MVDSIRELNPFHSRWHIMVKVLTKWKKIDQVECTTEIIMSNIFVSYFSVLIWQYYTLLVLKVLKITICFFHGKKGRQNTSNNSRKPFRKTQSSFQCWWLEISSKFWSSHRKKSDLTYKTHPAYYVQWRHHCEELWI